MAKQVSIGWLNLPYSPILPHRWLPKCMAIQKYKNIYANLFRSQVRGFRVEVDGGGSEKKSCSHYPEWRSGHCPRKCLKHNVEILCVSAFWSNFCNIITPLPTPEGVSPSPLARGLRRGWALPRKLSSFELKRRVLVHSGCYFCSWIEWKLVRPRSGMHWLASFGNVLISFDTEISISEDDDSRQTIHYRSVIDNLCDACVTYCVNVFIHSLFCLFVVLVFWRCEFSYTRKEKYYLPVQLVAHALTTLSYFVALI